MNDRPIQFNSLQAGRAFAALAVVVCHAALATAHFSTTMPGGAIFEKGYLGVDFFFVLSGFIIYYSSRGKSLNDYAWARFRRVYLPYFPVGVGIALLYTLFPTLSADPRPWSWLPTLTLLPVESETALFVAWTLKHEVMFYILFAIFHFSGHLRAGLCIWAVAIIAAFLTSVVNVPLAAINLEFMFGVGVAVAYRKGWGSPLWYLAAVPPIALWIALGAERDHSVLVGLGVAAIMLPTVQLEKQGKFAVPSWLVFLGAASYAIYLVHGFAISITSRLFSEYNWSVVFAAGILGGTAAGVGYYLIIERRILRVSYATPAKLPAKKELPSQSA